MKLSRTVIYAIKATMQLAEQVDGPPIPCSKISARGAMPERFLLQILRSLVTHGILKSTRGVDGGYVLLHPADQISLLDVIEAIEGPLNHDATFGQGLNEQTMDLLVGVLDDVNQAVRDRLASVKLSDLLVYSKDANTGEVQMEGVRGVEQEVSETPTCQTEGDDARVKSRIDLPKSNPVSNAPIIVSQPHVGHLEAIPPVNSGS